MSDELTFDTQHLETDEEFLAMLSHTDHLLKDIEESEQTGYQDVELRHQLYMSDLREVLTMEGGAGIRVLRWWVDSTGANDRTFQTNANVYRKAALSDYMKDRMAEIAASDPKSYLRLMLDGAMEWKPKV